jgi:hypothetical protein
MMPRFIIGVRELYDRRDGRWQGIDTGFGVSFCENAATSAIELVDLAPEQEQGQVAEEGGVDDWERKMLGDGTCQV